MSDSEDEGPPLLVAAPPPPPPSPPPRAVPEQSQREPVPVTILTGFLGAGKSTLLNFVLRNPGGRRIAVVENEFGPGLDIESLIARDGIVPGSGSGDGGGGGGG
eukprot:CAMPEP_0172594854 /NCGR_PEP_ID=MMETSP1068-20121228/14364_1 /TAXON_ID=35684 /ORGANISM="Pseudopedinella elastica, Strain CCMP716" /LENGTH=103 /DNA_ID=CAMNT_0013393111 /DNA_START=128 /DNA_END=436 /DNA_ORIENTATION=+